MVSICASCGQQTTSPRSSPRCEHCEESSLLNHRYQFQELIGQGATGNTWKALDCQQNLLVAIKELPWRIGDDSLRKIRFLREAEFLSQISHPNIPKYISNTSYINCCSILDVPEPEKIAFRFNGSTIFATLHFPTSF